MNKVRNALHDTIRADDTMAVPVDDPGFSVSTVGNGEFVMLLTDLSDTECTTWIVQRVLKRLGAVFELDGDELVLDARIGVSLFPTDSEEPDELVAFSAAALREAKSGRDFGQFLFYNKTMNDRSQHQLSLKSQLFRALEREEFFLEYQPSIDIESGSVIGLEALLRWHQPERGLVSPVDFIPIAEHAGLIDELGEWVMRTALEELRQWHEQGFKNLRMAVNFSALQFRRADLPDRIKSVIAEKALPPSSLVVEITETTLIQNLDSAIEIVQELSDAGVRIALDDFGTGYSSLSYLQRFPIDLVKIDKSFLRDFPAKAHDTEIVSAVVSIAHNLGLRVVAEGVETERQFTVLRNLACDEIQGFLFSKPLSRDAVSALMANPSSIRRTLRHANPGEFQPLDGQNQALADVVSHARFG